MDTTQYKRYSRHLNLPDFSVASQEKLLKSKVLIIGAGGLGCPVIQYLAAAGIGNITIIDNDEIELSNLQRQVLYTEKDLGNSKSKTAAKWVNQHNSAINCVSIKSLFSVKNAIQLVKEHDLMVDCTDNLSTRYLLNDACVLENKPFIFGSIFRYEGHVSTFNIEPNTAETFTYRDLFPTPPPPHLVQSCADGGILGSLAGIVGSIQAQEAIEYLVSGNAKLHGTLLIIDSKSFNFRKIKLQIPNNRYNVDKLIDYEYFCNKPITENQMKTITVEELKELMDNDAELQLIDVRETWENAMANIGGKNFPLAKLDSFKSEIDTTKKTIVYCRSGMRSANATMWMEESLGMTEVYNMEGGMIAWANRIDPSIEIS